MQSLSVTNHQQLSGKIALITGATRGIGYGVAKRFAAEGAHVIATGRSVAGLEELDDAIKAIGGTATLVPLNLLETDKIEIMAQSIAQRFGRLDILVGNAGILGELSPVAHSNPDDWDKVIAVNLTANFHLIRCFDPLLKLSAAPRAMFVSSGVTSGTYAYWGAYAVSKSALEKMVETYAAENAKTPLKANLIDPGGVRTRMRAKAFPGEDPETLPHPDEIADVFLRLAREDLQDTGKRFYPA
ncbi:MAG: SDR family NAD(P)-dependent oxidoreductase [Pseudomonadota bacterium]